MAYKVGKRTAKRVTVDMSPSMTQLNNMFHTHCKSAIADRGKRKLTTCQGVLANDNKVTRGYCYSLCKSIKNKQLKIAKRTTRRH